MTSAVRSASMGDVLAPIARVLRAAVVLAVVGLAAYVALPGLRDLVLGTPAGTPAPARSSAGPTIHPVVNANGTVTISLTEAQLTALAAPYFPQSALGITISDPKVRVGSGIIVMNATTQSVLGTGTLVGNATPSVQDGRLIVRLDSVAVGTTRVPSVISDQVASQLQAAIDSAVGPHLRVTAVSAESGALTISGVPLS